MRVTALLGGLAMSAACAALVLQGSLVLAGSLAQVRANDLLVAAAGNPYSDGAAAVAARLAAWKNIPGIRSAVRSQVIDAAVASRQLRATDNLESDLSQFLSGRPISGKAWLLLAWARHLKGSGTRSVLSALEMSILTAPHEDDVVAWRVIIGLQIWEALSPGLRNRTAAEFVVSGIKPEAFRDIYNLKSDDIKADIAGRIRIAAGAQTSWLSRYGL